MGKKRRKRFSVLSTLILISVIVMVLYFNDITGAAKNYARFGKAELEVVNTIEYSSALEFESDVYIHVSENFLVKCENKEFILYDNAGNPIWLKEFHAYEPLASVYGDKLAVADGSAGDIYLIDNKGNVLGSVFGLGKIDSIQLVENNLVVSLKTEGNILVYDMTLAEVGRIVLPTGDLITYDMSEKDDVLAVSVMKMDGSNFYSSVILYSINGDMLGATNFERQLIYGLKVYDFGIVGVSDEQVFNLSFDNQLVWERPIDRLVNAFTFSDDGFLCLNLIKDAEDLTDTRPLNVLQILDLNKNTILLELEIGMNVDKLTLSENHIAIYGDDKLYIMDMEGKVVLLQPVETEVRNFYWLDNESLIVEHIDKINIYNVNY